MPIQFSSLFASSSCYRTHNESLTSTFVTSHANNLSTKIKLYICNKWTFVPAMALPTDIHIFQFHKLFLLVLSACVIRRTSRSMPLSMCKLLQGVHHADGSRAVAFKTKEGDRGNAVAAHNFERTDNLVPQETGLGLRSVWIKYKWLVSTDSHE